MTRLALLASIALAAPALADQTEGRPWEICIPVDTAMAAAWEAAHPSTVYPLQRRAYAPLRDRTQTWAGARDDARRGWIEDDDETPAPIPAPAALWLALSAFAGLALIAWRARNV